MQWQQWRGRHLEMSKSLGPALGERKTFGCQRVDRIMSLESSNMKVVVSPLTGCVSSIIYLSWLSSVVVVVLFCL